jgi:hypothetical protein
VRVFRGCGFCRSNGTLPLVLCPSAPCGRRLVDAALARYVPGPEAVHSAVSLRSHSPVPVGSPSAGGRTRYVGGGGHSSMASASCARARTLCSPGPHYKLVGLARRRALHPPAAEAGARRRRRVQAEDSSRRRRALPRAGDGCADLWFQQGQTMALLWRTRDGTRTAARLRRGLA